MNQVAVWTPRPQEVSYLVRQQIDGGGFFFNVLARLKPGTTLAAASTQVATIAAAYSLSFSMPWSGTRRRPISCSSPRSRACC